MEKQAHYTTNGTSALKNDLVYPNHEASIIDFEYVAHTRDNRRSCAPSVEPTLMQKSVSRLKSDSLFGEFWKPASDKHVLRPVETKIAAKGIGVSFVLALAVIMFGV